MQDFYRVIADQGRRPNILSQIETGNEYFSYFIINLLVVQNVIGSCFYSNLLTTAHC